MQMYPKNRTEMKASTWRIPKDGEPGPCSYKNEPVKPTSARPLWGKEKKVTYMETHMNKVKALPAPGKYAKAESARDKATS
jgi:hypothetical protein